MSCFCARNRPPDHRNRSRKSNRRHHAAEPDLGRRLQPARDPTCRRLAISGLSYSAEPLDRRCRHGDEFGERARKQPAAPQLAAPSAARRGGKLN